MCPLIVQLCLDLAQLLTTGLAYNLYTFAQTVNILLMNMYTGLLSEAAKSGSKLQLNSKVRCKACPCSLYLDVKAKGKRLIIKFYTVPLFKQDINFEPEYRSRIKDSRFHN